MRVMRLSISNGLPICHLSSGLVVMLRSVYLGQCAIRQQLLGRTRVPCTSWARIRYPQGQYDNRYRRVSVSLRLLGLLLIDRSRTLLLVSCRGPRVLGLCVL